MLKVKLENGATVKVVQTEGKELSGVEGNVFTVVKYGTRKGEDEVRTATASRPIITREEIDALVEVSPAVGDFGLEDVCLQFNQTQREDAINSANAEIRGDGQSPEVSKAKTFVKLMEKSTLAEQKELLEFAETSGVGEALIELLGAERMEAIHAA